MRRRTMKMDEMKATKRIEADDGGKPRRPPL